MEERLRRALDRETCGAIRAEVRQATRDDLLRELRDELGDIDAALG